MNNTTDIKAPTDVEIYFVTIPPIFVPVSDRAKALMGMEDEWEGIVVTTEGDWMKEAFPTDFVFEKKVHGALSSPFVIGVVDLHIEDKSEETPQEESVALH